MPVLGNLDCARQIGMEAGPLHRRFMLATTLKDFEAQPGLMHHRNPSSLICATFPDTHRDGPSEIQAAVTLTDR